MRRETGTATRRWRRDRTTRRRSPLWLAPLLVAAFLTAGCGESTPGGAELVGPADREAVPNDPAIDRMTEAEREEERLEAAGLREPEPGDQGFETDED